GRKPEEARLSEPLQLLHHERADLGRRDFFLGTLLEHHFDAIGNVLDRGDAHRPLLARFQQAGNQLLPLEALPAAVLLHDHVRDVFDSLVARETLLAIRAEALPPAADLAAILFLARVDDLVHQVPAVRALHEATSRSRATMGAAGSSRAAAEICFSR